VVSTSLKGVLRQAGRDLNGTNGYTLAVNDVLFGNKDDVQKDAEGKEKFHAGCVQIMEAKLLAFPVRSLEGCFAWLTCPTILRRFQRDAGKPVDSPGVQKDQAIISDSSELKIQDKDVLEEYALGAGNDGAHKTVSDTLAALLDDKLWNDKLAARLAILHDQDFQHFVSTCTEVVSRIVIDPETRTNKNLFNQENIPCETLFYSVLKVLNPRRNGIEGEPKDHLANLLKANPTIQIGGDETTGHGFCELKHHELNSNA
jgi:CRISPR-associated protein Cmr4